MSLRNDLIMFIASQLAKNARQDFSAAPGHKKLGGPKVVNIGGCLETVEWEEQCRHIRITYPDRDTAIKNLERRLRLKPALLKDIDSVLAGDVIRIEIQVGSLKQVTELAVEIVSPEEFARREKHAAAE